MREVTVLRIDEYLAATTVRKSVRAAGAGAGAPEITVHATLPATEPPWNDQPGMPQSMGIPGQLNRTAQMSSVTLPPAAAIFSLAEPETASTETCSATETSPAPSTLTSSFLRTAPLATRSATVTSPPCG